MSPPRLQPAVFTILRDLIEDRTGLHYGLDDASMLEDKLAPRLLEAGFDSFLDYYYFLRYDPQSGAELQALTDSLVVNETYLFREFDPLQVLVRQHLAPKLEADPSLRLRVWSAACATGEEPLTLAMLLAQRGLLGRVELCASDIGERVLARARQGVYGRRSLRFGIPPGLEAYVTQAADGTVRVSPALVQAVRWERVNLVDGEAVRARGTFDAILCRNVLIYFTDATTCTVLASLTEVLRPGGRLLVGASESLLRYGTALECEERAGVFFYRRRAS